MVLNSIEKLLEKYDNGETTLKEEQRIKEYFAQDNVPEHLESYRLMFQYFNNTKQELYTKDVPLKPRKSYIYQWISVAAVAVLMIGIMVPSLLGDDVITPETVYTQDQLQAYNETKNALALLSTSFNDGASSVNTLGLVSTNFNKGAENVNRMSEFAKTTNKLVKRKNTQKH